MTSQPKDDHAGTSSRGLTEEDLGAHGGAGWVDWTGGSPSSRDQVGVSAPGSRSCSRQKLRRSSSTIWARAPTSAPRSRWSTRSPPTAARQAIVNGGDVSDYDSAGELVHSAIDAFGKLDILVNVAGILRDRMLVNMTPEEWHAVLNVHLTGTFNTSKHAAVHWREHRGEGQYRLINFTSAAGLFGSPGQPNYAAAKLGIVGFTLSCANALNRYGVTSNAIAPGAATRMTMSPPRAGGRDGGGPARHGAGGCGLPGRVHRERGVELAQRPGGRSAGWKADALRELSP